MLCLNYSLSVLTATATDVTRIPFVLPLTVDSQIMTPWLVLYQGNFGPSHCRLAIRRADEAEGWRDGLDFWKCKICNRACYIEDIRALISECHVQAIIHYQYWPRWKPILICYLILLLTHLRVTFPVCLFICKCALR